MRIKDLEKPNRARFMDLFRFATCIDYILLGLGCICSIIHGAIIPVMFYLLSFIIDAMSDSYNSGSFDATKFYDRTLSIVYMMIATSIIAFIVGYVGCLILFRVAVKQGDYFRIQYFENILNRPT